MEHTRRYLTVLESHPTLVEEEWDYEKNNPLGLYPDRIFRSAEIGVYWRCACGHSWMTRVSSRTNRQHPTGCPLCKAAKSFGEFAVFHCLRQYFGSENVKSRVKFQDMDLDEESRMRRFEVDILIEPLKIAIEHDGTSHLHASRQEADREKEALLEKNGYRLVRFRALKHASADNPTDVYGYKEGNIRTLERAIRNFFRAYTDTDGKQIDLRYDTMKILALYYPPKRIPCEAGDIRLRLATEWDFSRNEHFSIFHFAPASAYHAHWICRDCGYQWVSTMGNRIKRGCPACQKIRYLKTMAENFDIRRSFAYVCPDKMAQWDHERNEAQGLYPDRIVSGSAKMAYWKCTKCGNQWRAPVWVVADSTGNGCRMCGIESARQSKYKALLRLDPESGAVIQRYDSVSEAKAEGFRHPERGVQTGKIYKGYRWRLDVAGEK